MLPAACVVRLVYMTMPLLVSKGGGNICYSRSPRAFTWTPSPRDLAQRAKSDWSSRFIAYILLAIVSVLTVLFEVLTGAIRSHLHAHNLLHWPSSTTRASVLVMYIFSNTDPHYSDNLMFFLREGVQAGDGKDYLIVVNHSQGEQMPDLPSLPSNARYLLHNNECYDWGTFGWVLTTQGINLDQYSYFIFMNSSVRGPFLPTYIKGRVNWADVLLLKLTDEVKLVGPTINCQGSPGDNLGHAWRTNPHVQSYVVATDRIGLQILLDDVNVFKCYRSMCKTIYHSELGSSAAILNAGYNIDSLMVRYQGVDWRDHNNWGCNKEVNPMGNHDLDGGSLEAMEVMFIKVQDRLMEEEDWRAAFTATQYDQWYQQHHISVRPSVKENRWENDTRSRIAKVWMTAMKGMDCFDCVFYRAHQSDMSPEWSCIQLFAHFVQYGQFEHRQHRYICDVPFEELPLAMNAPDVMASLPHVAPERIAELIKASGYPMDTPTPRNPTGCETAAAATANTTHVFGREIGYFHSWKATRHNKP